MTAEKYFNMCEQLNQEPDPEKIPPEIDDFPLEVQKAILIFNKLGDRIYPDIGYIGKDYTQINTYMDVYGIQNRELFLEVLLRLDSHVIKTSQAKMKSEREKLKRKG